MEKKYSKPYVKIIIIKDDIIVTSSDLSQKDETQDDPYGDME